MTRDTFIEICDANLKMIRSEYSLSQEKMSRMLGISKKTLIGIEKSRSTLGWTGSIALCTVFSQSRILSEVLGTNIIERVQAIAFDDNTSHISSSWHKGILWQTVEDAANYRIEMNVISQHYRLLDRQGNILISSFNLEDLITDEREVRHVR